MFGSPLACSLGVAAGVWWFAAARVQAVPLAAAGCSNLLQNGGFESVSVTQGRVSFAHWTAAGAWPDLLNAGTLATEGNGSVHFASVTPRRAWVTQYNVPVAAGRQYRLSWRVKTILPDWPDGVKSDRGAFVKVERSGRIPLVIRAKSGQCDWQWQEAYFETPVGVTAITVSLGLAGSQGCCWFDDVSITAVE